MDEGALLPARLPLRSWLVGLFGFLAVHLFMFTYVHTTADTRLCIAQLPDPLFRIIPYDIRWWTVSIDLYVAITLLALATMSLQAIAGDHRPLVRWGTALAFQSLQRSLTILLVPLCRVDVPVGTAAVRSVTWLDLGFAHVPWHMWARNDLLFSGHVGEFLLILRATQSWPRWARGALWAFQGLQIYALLATRGHYTVDIVLAVPCAYFADWLAVKVMARMNRRAMQKVVLAPAAVPRSLAS